MILESFNSKLKVSEGVGYYDIKIIPTVCEGDKLPAFPILYSETEEKILCANLCLVDNYYMTTLALKTITELKEKEIPSIIYTKKCRFFAMFLVKKYKISIFSRFHAFFEF